MQQEVTQQFLDRLRRNLLDEFHTRGFFMGDGQLEAGAVFDRAALVTVMDGSDATPDTATDKYRERGKKAAATRKRNAQRKREQQDTTKGVRGEGGTNAGAGEEETLG